MKIKTQKCNNATIVELQGELNGDFVEQLEITISEIISEHAQGIVLDMTDVRFIDSLGLEQLLKTRDYCHQNDCELKLVGLDENCEKILEMTRLRPQFDCHVEVAQAVKSFV